MKKIISSLLAIVLLATFLPSAFAATSAYTYEVEITSTVVPAGCTSVAAEVAVENISSKPTSADTLLAVAYSETGALLDFCASTISMISGDITSCGVDLSSDTKIANVKIFVWDSWNNLTPLCRVLEYTPEQTPTYNYAIVLDVERTGGDPEEVTLLLPDGTTKTFDSQYLDLYGGALFDRFSDDYGYSCYIEALSNITERVIQYTVRNRTGELTSATSVSPTALYGEYDPVTKTLDGHRITSLTNVIDARRAVENYKLYQASQYSVFDKSSFESDTVYIGASYGNTAASSPFVLLTSTDKLYAGNTRFAVAKKVYSSYYDQDGDPCDMVEVLYDGEVKELLFKDGYLFDYDISAGDAFIFETDYDGFVNRVYNIYKAYDSTFTPFNNISGLRDKLENGWSYDLIDDNADFKYVRGIVVEAEDDSITFAEYDSEISSIDTNSSLGDWHPDGVVDYPVADNCTVYAYDPVSDILNNKDRFSIKSPSEIRGSNLDKYDTDGDGIYTADEGNKETMIDDASEAIAIIVDSEIVQIYVTEKTPVSYTNTVSSGTFKSDDYIKQLMLSTEYKFSQTSKIRFGNTYVDLSAGETSVYVNGIKDDTATFVPYDNLTYSNFEYYMEMARGDVTITKNNNSYSIYMTCYDVAKVMAVDIDNDEVVISILQNAFSSIDTIIIDAVDVSLGDVTLSVKKNGNVANVSDIKKGDIIAFATDFNDAVSGDLYVEGAIEILATDNKVTGTVDSTDFDNNAYTIGGIKYPYLYTVRDYTGKTMEVFLDPFGRIFSYKIVATADKYAIVLDVERTGGDPEEVTLLLPDGTTKTFDSQVLDLYGGALYDRFSDDYGYYCYIEDLADITDRVIRYTVRERTGELTSATVVVPSIFSSGEYNTRTGKLAGNKITSYTAIIDAQAAVENNKLYQSSQYEVFSPDQFEEDTPYSGAAYGATVDSTPFIILTNIDKLYGENTQFALATRVYTTAYNEDDDACDMVKVLYNGEEVELIFKDNAIGTASGQFDLAEGDLFIFETDGDGYVKVAYKVYDYDKTTQTGTTNWAAIPDNKLAYGWSTSLIDTNAEFQYVRGVVVDVDSSSITFADYNDNLTEVDTNEELSEICPEGVVTYAYASDCKAYICDLEEVEDGLRFRDCVSCKDPSSIKASNFDRFDQDDDGIFNADECGYENMNAYANEAVAIIVDGDIVAIYVIEK